MYWNHRVIRRVENDEESLYVVEVYYDTKDNSVMGWTENEAAWGMNIEEIRTTLTWMLESLDKPILDEAELLAEAEANREAAAESGAETEDYEWVELDDLLAEFGIGPEELDGDEVEPDEGFSVWDQD